MKQKCEYTKVFDSVKFFTALIYCETVCFFHECALQSGKTYQHKQQQQQPQQ